MTLSREQITAIANGVKSLSGNTAIRTLRDAGFDAVLSVDEFATELRNADDFERLELVSDFLDLYEQWRDICLAKMGLTPDEREEAMLKVEVIRFLGNLGMN
jgi:hypothetical protein